MLPWFFRTFVKHVPYRTVFHRILSYQTQTVSKYLYIRTSYYYKKIKINFKNYAFLKNYDKKCLISSYFMVFFKKPKFLKLILILIF